MDAELKALLKKLLAEVEKDQPIKPMIVQWVDPMTTYENPIAKPKHPGRTEVLELIGSVGVDKRLANNPESSKVEKHHDPLLPAHCRFIH